MTLGENIRKYRKEKKKTQKELATLIGKKEITIRKYESGDIAPSIGALNKITKALNVTINDLVGIQRTITQKVLDELLSNGISLEKISQNSKIPIDEIKAMYDNNQSLIQPGSLKKLAEYLNVDKQTMFNWFFSDVITDSIYNDNNNDPKEDLIKKFFLNEPLTLDDLLLNAKDENEKQHIIDQYSAGNLDLTRKNHIKYDLNVPIVSLNLLNYLKENSYPVDKLSTAEIKYIDKKIIDLLDFEFYKLEKNNYKIQESKND